MGPAWASLLDASPSLPQPAAQGAAETNWPGAHRAASEETRPRCGSRRIIIQWPPVSQTLGLMASEFIVYKFIPTNATTAPSTPSQAGPCRGRRSDPERPRDLYEMEQLRQVGLSGCTALALYVTSSGNCQDL